MVLIIAILLNLFALSYEQSQACASGESLGPDLGDCQPGSVSVNGHCCPIGSVVTVTSDPTIVVTLSGGESTQTDITVSSLSTSSFSSMGTVASSACVDKVNPFTGVSDCPSRASLCNYANYYILMTQQCPKTCGRCSSVSPTTVSSTCQDFVNPSTGVSDCPSHAYLCTNSTYFTLMKIQCPKTCGFCSSSSLSSTISSSTCVDFVNPLTGVSDCPSYHDLCTNLTYVTFMKAQCPLTCGYCSK